MRTACDRSQAFKMVLSPSPLLYYACDRAMLYYINHPAEDVRARV